MTARPSPLTAVIGGLSFTAGVLNQLGNIVSAVFYVGALVLWIVAAYVEIATRPSREALPRQVTCRGYSCPGRRSARR